jgi:hypothetical protein
MREKRSARRRMRQRASQSSGIQHDVLAISTRCAVFHPESEWKQCRAIKVERRRRGACVSAREAG